MAYIALYREWRPKRFSDMVGQKHVSKTLKNAIQNNRIAHAYLFCGPRGTGKTSSAKILAKALNCLEPVDYEPCNECENCLRINSGASMDVLEIDAASNRGIDEIRDLREKIKFVPSEGKYKVYIIDEVHMLTTEAFNALLKTLEEPPSHAIFVLATTEPQKIPLTILSRCQRFDFKRIDLPDIVEHLEHIAQVSQVNIELEALKLIAKVAEGGMRDALSILDQAISFGGNQITSLDVNNLLGSMGKDFIHKVAKALVEGNTKEVLALLAEVVTMGKDIKQFLKDLIEYFRDLLLVDFVQEETYLASMSSEDLEKLKGLHQAVSSENIMSVLNSLMNAEQSIKWTNQPRLTMELALIKASSIEQGTASPAEDLEARLSLLEQKITSGFTSTAIPARTPNKTVIKPRATVNLGENNEQELLKIQQAWHDILEGVKKIRVTARAFLTEANPVHVENSLVTLSFKNECVFHRENIEQHENKKAVEYVISRVLGRNIQIRALLAKEIAASTKVEEKQPASLKDAAVELFGADVVEIKD